MRFCGLAVIFSLAIGCGSNPSVPPTSPTSTAGTSPASPILLRVRPDYLPGIVGSSQQFKAVAVFSNQTERDVTAETTFQSSDPTIAEISPSGLLRAIQPGSITIRGLFQSIEGLYSIDVRYPTGKAPGELFVHLREADPEGSPYLYGEVEIVGGDYNGKVLKGTGEVLFTGIYQAGFDLIARSAGYQSARYHVSELPVSPHIELRPDSSVVSEVLEAPVCPQQPASRSFRTSSGGIFRITFNRFGYYEGGPGIQVLLPGGTQARPVSAVDRVYEFPPGGQFELRISLDWDCTTFRVNYLRPRF